MFMFGYYFVASKRPLHTYIKTSTVDFVKIPYDYYNTTGQLLLAVTNELDSCSVKWFKHLGQDNFVVAQATEDEEKLLTQIAEGKTAVVKSRIALFECEHDVPDIINVLEECDYYELRYTDIIGFNIHSFTIIGENDKGNLLILAIGSNNIRSSNNTNILEISTNNIITEARLKCTLIQSGTIYLNQEI